MVRVDILLGGLLSVNNAIAGETVASFLKRNKKLRAGSRFGAQKNAGNGWEDVKLDYRIKSSDRIRVKAASGGHGNARGLKALVRAIVLAQKR
jgi:hypothetical protein